MAAVRSQLPNTALFLLTWCGASLPAAAGPSSHQLIDPPAYEQARLSPDGRYLAYTVDFGFQDVLITARTLDMKILRTTRLPAPQSVGKFEWIGPERLVFSTHTRIGSIAASNDIGNWQAIDADGGNPRQFLAVKYTATRYQVADPLLDDPESLLMVGNAGSGSELFRINTLTGSRTTLHQIDKTNCSYLLDAGQPRILTCPPQGNDVFSTVKTQYRIASDGSLVPLASSPRIVQVSPGGNAFAVQESAAGDSFGTIDLDSGRFSPSIDLAGQSITDIMHAPGGSAPFAVVSEPARPQITLLSPSDSDSRRFQAIQDSFPGEYVHYLNATQDGRQTLLSVASDRNPGQLYLHDRATNQSRLLLTKRPAIEPDDMAQTTSIQFRNRTGQLLHAYLTLPPASTSPPLVVLPHGGPWGVRDRWLFDAERQWLASKGFAVLQVNYRGSSGYGQAFQDHVFGQWPGVVDDILDATHHLISTGQVDADRICSYGSSFGAYAAVMAAVREPSLFKCVAGQAGPYSAEITLSQSDIARTETGKRYLLRSMGGSEKERGAVDAIKYADRLSMPVFLAAGETDPRTPPDNTGVLAKALASAGNPPTVLLIPGQGHGFYGQENHRYHEALLAFLTKHLQP